MNINLTKDQFVDCINFIREKQEAEDKINEVFTAAFGDSIFFPYSDYETKYIKLLELVMQDTGMWISVWIYEMNFGEKNPEVYEQDGTVRVLKTPEDLYNFLILNIKEREK